MSSTSSVLRQNRHYMDLSSCKKISSFWVVRGLGEEEGVGGGRGSERCFKILQWDCYMNARPHQPGGEMG